MIGPITVSLGISVHRQQWPSVNDLFIALCSDVGGPFAVDRRVGRETRTNPSIRRTDSGVETRLREGNKSQTSELMCFKVIYFSTSHDFVSCAS